MDMREKVGSGCYRSRKLVNHNLPLADSRSQASLTAKASKPVRKLLLLLVQVMKNSHSS